MNCRDVQELADTLLREELRTKTNPEVLRHLDACPSCRTEIETRRRLRRAVRTAFHRAPHLQPTAEFSNRLRDQLQLRQAVLHGRRSWTTSGRWLALAAGLVLAAGVTAGMFLNGSTAPTDALARDAIGDHWNCALKYRLVRMPVPLEEAAQRFDSAYRLLLSAPPDDISTADGPARVVERHSCAYGARRFGHVILEYRGRVVSLLVTANGDATNAAEVADTIPHVIGRPVEGLSAVSVNGSRHAVVLVSDLASNELTRLAGAVSLPLVQRLRDVASDNARPTAWLIARPVEELAWDSDRRPDLRSLLTSRRHDDIPTVTLRARQSYR